MKALKKVKHASLFITDIEESLLCWPMVSNFLNLLSLLLPQQPNKLECFLSLASLSWYLQVKLEPTWAETFFRCSLLVYISLPYLNLIIAERCLPLTGAPEKLSTRVGSGFTDTAWKHWKRGKHASLFISDIEESLLCWPPVATF